MQDEYQFNRSWYEKFRSAFVGLRLGVHGQSSFFVHLFMAVLVVLVAAVMRVGRAEWCLLLVCITMVLAAEMFNSAIERIAPAITTEEHPEIGAALDISSAAVLITSVGSAAVGGIIFLNRLGELLSWW